MSKSNLSQDYQNQKMISYWLANAKDKVTSKPVNNLEINALKTEVEMYAASLKIHISTSIFDDVGYNKFGDVISNKVLRILFKFNVKKKKLKTKTKRFIDVRCGSKDNENYYPYRIEDRILYGR